MSLGVCNENNITPHINNLMPPVLSYIMPSGYHSATILCIQLPSQPQDFSSNHIIEQRDSLLTAYLNISPLQQIIEFQHNIPMQPDTKRVKLPHKPFTSSNITLTLCGQMANGLPNQSKDKLNKYRDSTTNY